ncbi:MAG: hypothetical protein MJ188_09120, partial [Treponema sp.]|nr:hypothetical protein [Treponema sp.]
PFSNGGSLPPEQSVNNETSEEKRPAPVLDERLKINIPSLQTDSETGEFSIPMAVPVSSTGYTLNPDDEDDGWTNTDEPPEETYYPSDEVFQNYDDSAFAEPMAQSAPIAAPQVSDFFTTADGRKISVAQLRGNVKVALENTDSFASSTLDKTGAWKINQKSVETTVSNQYDKEIITKKIPVIAKEISNICGTTMEFIVNYQEPTTENKAQTKRDIPPQVNMVINAFKGTLVNG